MSKVNPIPDGYHSITPYLAVRQAAKAIEFYKKAFGAEELFRIPMPGDTIGHAELKIGDSIFMLSDENLEWGNLSPLALKGTPVFLNLYVNDCDAVIDRAVKAGATLVMAASDQFYGDRNGRITDPFGHHWIVGTHKEDLTPEQIAERAAKRGG